MYKELLKKIKLKKIKICIVGLGYVGLPLAIRLIKSKVNVYGYDIDKKKVAYLKKGKSYISNIKNKEVDYFKKNKNNLLNSISNFNKVDVIIVCLPTPLNKNNEPVGSVIILDFDKIEDAKIFVKNDPYNDVDLFSEVKLTKFKRVF